MEAESTIKLVEEILTERWRSHYGQPLHINHNDWTVAIGLLINIAVQAVGESSSAEESKEEYSSFSTYRYPQQGVISLESAFMTIMEVP